MEYLDRGVPNSFWAYRIFYRGPRSEEIGAPVYETKVNQWVLNDNPAMNQDPESAWLYVAYVACLPTNIRHAVLGWPKKVCIT